MNREQKLQHAADLRDCFTRAKVSIFVDYKGLTATQADEIRSKVRATNGSVKVIKNNVARQLVKSGDLKGGAAEVLDSLAGPTMVAFGFGDLAQTAKVVHQFSKDIETFQIKDCLMGETRVSPSQVEQLASLPSREVLLSMLLRAMNGPITSFASVLAAVPRALVTVLSQIEKKKTEG
jgi:large subunit ribosomal protein L10